MKLRLAVVGIVGFAAVTLLVGPAAFAGSGNIFPYSSIVPSITVNGDGLAPLTLKTSELAALPQTTITATLDGKTVSATGPLLSSLLSYAGLTYNAACDNDELRYWVEVTSVDGSATVLTAGELDSGFGNRPAILAISENGGMLTTEGPTLVVPNDSGARDLAHVTKVTVGRAPVELADTGTPGCGTAGQMPSPPAGTVIVNGDVANPLTLTVAQLQAMPQVSQTDTYLSGSKSSSNTEVGPTLYSVIEMAKPKFLACDVTDDQRFYVEVTSSEDGYATTYSWTEIDPSLDNVPMLLSLVNNGVPVLQTDTDPRSTAPNDVKGGRYVYGTAVVTVLRAPTETRIPSCTSTTAKG